MKHIVVPLISKSHRKSDIRYLLTLYVSEKSAKTIINPDYTFPNFSNITGKSLIFCFLIISQK
jgi:hypothetical protein